uniref:p1-P2 fusion protein n=1 Tax=Suakwa aphid-borne yellows virus TaxID=646010 RepID=A0A173G650_9VIRU|nr:P1-P2 fusion protein [Suakwa aphid-borne yellows virus]
MKNMQFVVLFFFCLSASTLCWPEVGLESSQAHYPALTSNLSSNGHAAQAYHSHTDWKETRMNFGFYYEEPEKPDLNQIIAESSYTDILILLSNKILLDSKSAVSVALSISQEYWASCVQIIRAFAFRVFKAWLEGIIMLWIYVISAILSGLTWALLNLFPHMITVIFLCFFTNLLVKIWKTLCGSASLVFLQTLFSPFFLAKRILTWILVSLSGGYLGRKLEKATEGWKSFEIKMDPPLSSSLPVRNKVTKEHSGYCGFVQTHMKNEDGTFVEAFITARHVIDDDLGEIHSLKTKNFIACADLEVLGDWESIDLILLRAPKNVRSYLGCKPASIVAIDRLATCDASTFYLKENEWCMSNARLVGGVTNGVAVLSNSVCGHSGSPFYNGKNILGVLYGGGSYFENFNIMNPIPAIPGLTTPERQLESTAPRGKIFNDEDFSRNLEDEYQRAKNFKSNTGVNWADLPSDDEVEFEDALPAFRKAEKAEPSRPANPTHEPAVRVGEINSNISGNRREQGRLLNQRLHIRCCEEYGKGYGSNGGQLGHVGHTTRSGPNLSRPALRQPEKDESRSVSTWEARGKQADGYRQYFQNEYNWEVYAPKCEVPGFRQCGSLPKYYFSRQKGETIWGQTLTRNNPSLGEATAGYGWPEFGAEAELTSLKLQAARWRERASSAKIPYSSERERVIRIATERYSKVKSVAPACSRSGELKWEGLVEDLKDCLPSLSLDAGVGVPYIAYKKPTLGSWVNDPALLPILSRLVFDRLKKMSETRFDDMTPEELVQNDLCDPIRTFVKGEPHKLSKLKEGRYRLIMSVSIVDQLVARVLFQNQNKSEIALWRAIPSKPGLGLSTDEQVLDFVHNLAENSEYRESVEDFINNWHKTVVPTDCSGFDWSVSSWMLEDDMEVRNNLTINNNELTRRLRACWLKCISNSVICLSDGTLLAQEFSGIQKSGSYNTSSTNSRVRVMLSIYAGASWAIAMGDDALESADTVIPIYGLYGLKVEVSDKLEFCSHEFKSSSLAIPVNVGKMLYKLIHGYEIYPGMNSIQVTINYLTACYSVLNELRHVPEASELVAQCLAPVEAQKV